MQGKATPEGRAQAPVYAGVDVCKERLDIHLHPTGQRMHLTNDWRGCQCLKRTLRKHKAVLVVMEATAKYHRRAQRMLAEAGIPVAVVNPLRARLFAEASGTLAKTDGVDARGLALLGQALEPRATPPVPHALEALQELVRARSAATAERTALANRLGASQTAFLKAELRRRIKSLDGHIERLAKQIARRIEADPALARRHAILVSVPGIGPAVAAALIADLAELGALDRHAAASLAGLAPFPDDSGERTGQRHIKGGRAHARRALYMAALSAARCNSELKAFYRRLIEKGKKAKVALVAVMRKLIVLANTLLKEDRTWAPTKP